MKCPGCGGEVPHVALKCKHCGTALKKQAPPPPPPKRGGGPEDPMKALAREALEAQKAKAAKTPTGKLPPPPPARKTPTGKLPPEPAAEGPVPGAPEDADAFVPARAPDKRRQMLTTVAIGLGALGAIGAFSQTAYAQRQLTAWAAGTAVRNVEFEPHEAADVGAGHGQFRAPKDGTEIPDLPEGRRGLQYDLTLELAFRGKREVHFGLVGVRQAYEEVAAAVKATSPESREFKATYGKTSFRSIRYKLPAPGEGAGGALITHRYYVSQTEKDGEPPFSVEFVYTETPENKVLIDRLIERILGSVVE